MRTARPGFLLFLTLFGFTSLRAQLPPVPQGQASEPKPRSLALKDPATSRGLIHVPPDNSDEELWDEFMLVQHANAGDPVAEHQLGLRYLLGKGFFADTVRAAEWIGRAARKNLLTARYNFGILQNNGWGVRWNPFESFRNIQYAAHRGLTDAEFVYGIFFLEDLVVRRDVDSAYRWIRAAADSGFAPAADALREMRERGMRSGGGDSLIAANDPGSQNQGSSIAQPVFLDLGRDSLPDISDSTLAKEALRHLGAGGNARDRAPEDDPADTTLSAAVLVKLRAAAEAGSPEALTMLGRLAETGRTGVADPVTAAAYYVRALRFDSPRAPGLLWKIVRDESFFALLKSRVDRRDPEAEFVWSGLVDLGFDNRLADAQALAFLTDAARQKYPDALVQLGICYYGGKWTKRDRQKGIGMFEEARAMGNKEAGLRTCVLALRAARPGEGPEPCVALLREQMDAGSLLAEATLGYCFERGLGVRTDTARSVTMFRNAAERGSKLAYDELRGLYDALRPAHAEFLLAPHRSKKDLQ